MAGANSFSGGQSSLGRRAPIARPTFQHYVLAHLFLGAAVTFLTLLVARSSLGRHRARLDPPNSTQ